MSRSTSLAESLLTGGLLAAEATHRPSATVHRLVESAARQRRGLTLNEAQVSELRRLLEAMRDDPFSNDNSVIDTDGLDALGLEVSEQQQLGIADGTYDPVLNRGNAKEEFHAERRQPQIGVQASLVAPNATVDHNRPIPSKVAIAMMAVSPDSFTETQPSSAVAQRAPTPVHGMPTAQPRPRPEQPQAPSEGDDVLSAVQRARSQKQKSPYGGLRKTRPRAGNQGPVPADFSNKLRGLGSDDE